MFVVLKSSGFCQKLYMFMEGNWQTICTFLSDYLSHQSCKSVFQFLLILFLLPKPEILSCASNNHLYCSLTTHCYMLLFFKFKFFQGKFLFPFLCSIFFPCIYSIVFFFVFFLVLHPFVLESGNIYYLFFALYFLRQNEVKNAWHFLSLWYFLLNMFCMFIICLFFLCPRFTFHTLFHTLYFAHCIFFV